MGKGGTEGGLSFSADYDVRCQEIAAGGLGRKLDSNRLDDADKLGGGSD